MKGNHDLKRIYLVVSLAIIFTAYIIFGLNNSYGDLVGLATDRQSILCTDSDGGQNIFVRGTTKGLDWTTNKRVSKRDDCVRKGTKAGRLAEFYCLEGRVASVTFGPEDGCSACKNGACAPSSSVQVLSPNGGEVWEQNPAKGQFVKWSGATERKPSDFKVALTDPRGNFVGWIMHNSPQKDPAGGFQLIWDVISACKTEFVGGFTDCFKVSPEFYKVEVVDMITKKTDASDAPFSIVPPCYDSDGGLNYYVKGYAYSQVSGRIINDTCNPQGNLQEAFCNNQVALQCNSFDNLCIEITSCPNGCKDGACIQANQTAACGDGKLNQPNEECDILDFAGKTCQSFGYAHGTLKCTATCQLDTTSCIEKPKCGNGAIDLGETCDGTNFGNLDGTCKGYNPTFASGNLTCVNCKIDTSGCFLA